MFEKYDITKNCTGRIHMILHRGEYGTPNMKILKEQFVKNLIVSNASLLMASLLNPANIGTGGVATLQGIQYLAVGTGYGTGTQTNPQPEASNQSSLRSELMRKSITSSTVANNILTLTTTFNETEAVGDLVEMGLIGGNATTSANTGYLFNYKVFSVWSKPNGFKFTVIWTLTL